MQPGMAMEQLRRFTDYGGGLGKAPCIALLIFSAAMTPMGSVRVQPAKMLIEESTTNETASETRAPHEIYLEVFANLANLEKDKDNRVLIARFMMTVYNFDQRSFGDIKEMAVHAIKTPCDKSISDRRFPTHACIVPGKGFALEDAQHYCKRGFDLIDDTLSGNGAKFISHVETNRNKFGVDQFTRSLDEILPAARKSKTPARQMYTLGPLMTTNLLHRIGMAEFDSGDLTPHGPTNHYFMELPPVR